jgi:hypothetical protein
MARTSRKHLYDSDNNAATHIAENVFFRAAAYIRLSCDDTKKRGDSIETQNNIIENFAAILRTPYQLPSVTIR